MARQAIDLFVDANVVLLLACLCWLMARRLIVNGPLRHDYRRQLFLLKGVLLTAFVSPVVVWAAAGIGAAITPSVPMTVGDIAVAAFLRGDIAIPAVQFEALLNARARATDAAFAADLPWLRAVFALLAAAGVALACRTAVSLWRLNRVIGASYLWRRTGGTDIRVSDTAAIPFAARGLRRRHVVIPSGLLARRRELSIVLAHEFAHLRARDVEWELALELLRPLLFWNPAFHVMKRSLDGLRELSCDRAVMTSRGIAAEDYARCLLDICARRLSEPGPRPAGVGLVGARTGASRRALETRIRAMYAAPLRPRGGPVLGALFAVLSMTVVLSAASLRESDAWSHDRIMLSTVVNLERLDARNARE